MKRPSLHPVGGLAVRGRAASAVGVALTSLLSVGLRRTGRMIRNESGRVDSLEGEIYSAIWHGAATRIDATTQELEDGTVEIRRSGRSIRVCGALVPLDNPVTLHVAGNKVAVHRLLDRAGLPVPAHAALRLADFREAERFLDEVGRVVVKPAQSTSGGAGVTGGVRTTRDLLAARLRAGRYDGHTMLIEEQLEGDEYRLLVIGGEPVAAVRRRVPTVVGDGRSSIAALIDAENQRRDAAGRAAGYRRLVVTLDTVLALRAHGFTLRRRPPPGCVVPVSNSTSSGSEKDASNVSIEDPELGELPQLAASAGRAIGLDFASVEFMVRPGGDEATIIEVNSTPGIAHHYVVSDGVDSAVATRVLEYLFDRNCRG